MVSLLFLPNVHAALLNQWGSFTQISTLNCDADPCNSVSNQVIGPTDFAPLSTFSDVTYSDATFGSAEAHANVSAASGLNTPNLRAQAAANAGVGVLGVARGVDAYTYLGATPTTIDLIVTLTGTVTNPNDARFTRILADVYVMDADQAEALFPLGGDSILLQSRLPTPDSTSIGLSASSPLNIAVGAVSFEANPGDSFYVLANLATQAFDTGTAVSMNSLSMSFAGDPELVAASSTVVPVPAAVWLFGSGLVALIGLVARKPERTGSKS